MTSPATIARQAEIAETLETARRLAEQRAEANLTLSRWKAGLEVLKASEVDQLLRLTGDMELK